MGRILTLLVAIALAGCGGTTWTREHRLLCPLDETPMQRETLYFGLSRPDGGVVGDAEWNDFVRATLGVAFPNGLTILDAHGQWRGADGTPVREDTRVVLMLHPFEPASEHAVVDVIRAYRERFAQESVLRERSVSCVKF